MKKTVFIIFVMLLFTVPVIAGSIPEDLLHEDFALVFFGELVSVGEDNVEVKPSKKIKGDINCDTKQVFLDPYFIKCEPNIGKTYLFTYFDENNPVYIFKTTSTDTKTLEFEGIDKGSMFGRLQEYLNQGLFEEAESKRTEKQAVLIKENSKKNKFYGFIVLGILFIGLIVWHKVEFK